MCLKIKLSFCNEGSRPPVTPVYQTESGSALQDTSVMIHTLGHILVWLILMKFCRLADFLARMYQ